MKNIILFIFLLLLFSCKKEIPVTEPIPVPVPEDGYIQYTINAGAHYCNSNTFKVVSLSEMNFKVKFDNSAIYQTIDPLNQNDINKLYGFSEGHDHQLFSARIGWAWYKAALRLYAYTYNNGIRSSKEITTVKIGAEIICGIKVSGNDYIFNVNNVTVTMARAGNSTVASGYQLYPYFGGDEVAAADIHIQIMDLP